MERNIQLRILTYVVIAYMLLAFSWWTVLLYQKNQDAYNAKAELMEIIMAADKQVANKQEFYQTEPYLELTQKYKRQEWMILSEAAVFVISLVIGVWLINRGYNREVMAAQQRRNFLLSITHELKSPIASIKLTLETFIKRMLKPEQINQLSSSALHEADRLNTLVNDLLLAAKLESAYQPAPEDFDLKELVDELTGKMQQKYHHAAIEIQTPDIPLDVFADPTGMTSVILNLIENAIKYSFENPQIKVELIDNPFHILYRVSDQGIGIPNKEKKNVFNRFYRIGNEDTRQTKGTGLGLYIVNEIVKAHEGTIQIKNNQPKGSIFEVKLPKSK